VVETRFPKSQTPHVTGRGQIVLGMDGHSFYTKPVVADYGQLAQNDDQAAGGCD
jgi:hypothetical protein